MEATRIRFVSRAFFMLSTILLATVMLICIPQGQAQAVETSDNAVAGAALQEHIGTLSLDGTATEVEGTGTAKQAAGSKSSYGLLTKDGFVYPCNKKGKKLGKYWKGTSTVKTLFVATNVKKVKALSKMRLYYKVASTRVYAKISTVKFLTKKGKSSVTTINVNAFKGHTYLKKVINFNKTKATKICNGAFYGTNLNSIVFPKTLKVIGSDAFNGTKLKKLTFPKGVTSIGARAFSNMPKLTTVVGFEKTKYYARMTK